MSELYHALGFHMHQPPQNLELLWRENEWEARQIMLCYQRPLRYAERFRELGRFHVDFSGTLLEQLLAPVVKELYRPVLDVDQMLASYRAAPNIELLATGYFHPIFPLIPRQDWAEHLNRSLALMEEIFGRRPRGFWPPEMAFSMDMVSALVEAGFEYVVVDDIHVIPEENTAGEERSVCPYLARHDQAEMAIVPRHRDLSNAQESGMTPEWLSEQVAHRSHGLSRPALFTTWSDGENGGWFRQTAEEAGFWGYFYAPYMEQVEHGEYPVRPVLLGDYLAEHRPSRRAEVRTGAWNVGSTGGFDFSQWAGSASQKAALERVWETSRTYRLLRRRLDAATDEDNHYPEAEEALHAAHDLILRSETSCYFFWGDSWVPKAQVQLDAAQEELQRAAGLLGSGNKG